MPNFFRIASVALCVASSALALPSFAASEAITRGGTLVYGRYADSQFLDPVLAQVNVDIWILSNLYDTLLLPTEDGKGVQPGLASAWTVSPDGKTVTLTLRKAVTFSDGSPITADDVKWSLDRARDPKAGIWNFIDESIASIEVKDPQTVVLNLQHADPTIVSALAVFNNAIMPMKLFMAARGATPDEKAKSFAEHPVGSGAFVLKSWSRGQEMTLVRNEHYWRTGTDGKSLPYLDGVRFEILPDDATRILKVQSGELDGAELIPFSRVGELKADTRLNMALYPSTSVRYGIFNVRPQFNDGSSNPLANDKVREALNLATDKDAIIAIVTHGVGTPMSSYMSSATPLHTGTGTQFPFDAAKAKASLAEAGFPNGFSLTCQVLAGNVDEVGIATALQQMWADVGVELKLEQIDNATRNARQKAGDFMMRLASWSDDISDPSEISAYGGYYPNIKSFRSGWNNDEFNKLFEQSQSELDAGKRASLYDRMQKIYRNGPTLPLYESPFPVMLKNDVKSFSQIPLGNNIFSGVHLEK